MEEISNAGSQVLENGRRGTPWSSWLSLGSNSKGGLPLFFVLVTAVNIEAAIEAVEAVEAAEATVSLLQFLLELMHLQLMQTSSTLDVL